MKELILDRFIERTVIFTGIDAKLCKETALRAAKEGARIVLTQSQEGSVNDIEEAVKEYSPRIKVFTDDLASTEGCNALIEQTVKTFGSVDIFICSEEVLKQSQLVECILEAISENKHGGKIVAVNNVSIGEDRIKNLAGTYLSKGITVNEVIPSSSTEDTTDVILQIASSEGGKINGKIIRAENGIGKV